MCVYVCVFLSFYLYDVLHYVTFLLSAIESVYPQRGSRAEMLYVYTCDKLTFHLADYSLRFYIPEPIEKFNVFKVFTLFLPAISEIVIRTASIAFLIRDSSYLLSNVGSPQNR